MDPKGHSHKTREEIKSTLSTLVTDDEWLNQFIFLATHWHDGTERAIKGTRVKSLLDTNPPTIETTVAISEETKKKITTHLTPNVITPNIIKNIAKALASRPAVIHELLTNHPNIAVEVLDESQVETIPHDALRLLILSRDRRLAPDIILHVLGKKETYNTLIQCSWHVADKPAQEEFTLE